MTFDDKFVFGVLSVLVTIWCAIPYILGILRGTTKPHVFTWLLWSLTTGIAAAAQLYDGGGAGAWSMVASGTLCFVIFLMSLKSGEKHITRSDWVTLAVGLSAIPLWLVTKDPLWSVIIVCSIDALAYIPTFRKSWAKPQEEAVLMYVLALVWQAMSVFALENYTLVTVLSPATLLTMNASLVTFLWWRRKVLA